MEAVLAGTGGAQPLTVDPARTYRVQPLPGNQPAWAKDPVAVLNYTWDWARWLGEGEAIASASVTGAGVEILSAIYTGATVTAQVRGGAPGLSSISCHITTLLGQQDDRTIQLIIREC